MQIIQQREEKIVKEIKIPELAESIEEGTISEWLVKVGDKVSKGDPLVELETDKVNVEVNSEFEGVIVEILQDAGSDVTVGDVIGKLDENAEAGAVSGHKPVESESKEEATPARETKQPELKEEPSDTQQDDASEVVASPAARKLARELNIDLSKVKAQDPYGRIRPDDVEAAANAAKAPKQVEQQASSSSPTSEQQFSKPVKREKMSRRRMTIAKRLVEAQHNAAMLTTFNEVDMSAIMNLRKERQENFVAKNDIKLGFMSFFTKASVAALKEFPLLNAEIDGNELIIKEFYDIGIAEI